MILRLCLAVLAMTGPVAADASLAVAEDGVCFNIHDRTIRYCVSPSGGFRLIEAEYDGGALWVDFEANLLSLNVTILPNPEPGAPFPQTYHEALDRSLVRHEFSRGIELDAYLIRHCADVAVFEAEARSEETNEIFVEITTPSEVMYLVLTDFTPEFDDVSIDFDDARFLVRDHTACPGGPLFPPLLPITETSDQ